MDRRQIGARAERRARDFLASQGLEPLLANYRCRLGELDLVLRDGAALVVVEVRLRGGVRFGGAGASIGARKRRRIVLATRHLLLARRDWRELPIRFDVIAIDAGVSGADAIEWIRGAFAAED